MSDSITTEQGGSTSAPPEPEYRPSESLSSEPEAPAEATQADAPAAEHEETDTERYERERKEYNRRLGQITKQKYLERERANQAERERQELARRLAQYEGQNQQNGVPADWMDHPQVRAMIQAEAAEQARRDGFLRAGAAEFPDWDVRRHELIKLGADAELAQMLVHMDDGHRIAAALYDDPAELGRISDLTSPVERARELGRLAGRIEARRAAPPPPQRRASNLSEPIRPPSTARSRGAPDPEKGNMEEFMRWSGTQNWRNR